MIIRIGSRGSELALWQAEFVGAQLRNAGAQVEIVIIKTRGDHIQDIGFDKMEGKGFFTKELEDALLKMDVDLAVHSMKDLPTTAVDGLLTAAVSYREDPTESLLIHPDAIDDKQKFSLRKNAKVGTSSSRRKSQFRAHRPDVEIKDLRGNVPTRIEKLKNKQYDAILVASAGLERINPDLGKLKRVKIPAYTIIPAPAQGVLALQCRENDKGLIALLSQLNDKKVSETVKAERTILSGFDGGCQLPLGVYCYQDKNEDEETESHTLVAYAASPDKAPVYMHLIENGDFFSPEKTIAAVKNIKPCRVFITKNLQAGSLFRLSLEDNGFSVQGNALITIKSIPFKTIPDSDWIFFSSKNAVEHFFKPGIYAGSRKIGVVGKATADALRAFGHRATFIGQHTHTAIIGRQFAAMAGKSKVLFPVARESMKSIQHQMLKKDQVINLVVYETLFHPLEQTPEADIAVFTSPSNVRSFLQKHDLSGFSGIVAMGQATANEIARLKTHKVTLADRFDDMGLLQAVYKLCTKI